MIEILRPGPQTTVQDAGRTGCEHLGISQGGAADILAYARANQAAGNPSGSAALECLLAGPTFRTDEDVFIATAAIREPQVDGVSQPPWSGFRVRSGSTVRCEALERARGYIAFQGGIDVPMVLGSRSTNLEVGFGGWEGRALRTGDSLAIGGNMAARFVAPGAARPPAFDRPPRLRVVPGPRFDDFTAEMFARFMGSTYRVSHDSNRVGIRLEGPAIASHTRGSRISEPMPVGAVQITPSGQPVILLAARGTMGGYPIIATVITPDVWKLGQALPGDQVEFQETSYDEARSITQRAYAELGK